MGLTLTPAQPSLSPLVVGQHSTAKFKKNRLKQINALFGAAGATSVVLQILEEVEISCQWNRKLTDNFIETAKSWIDLNSMSIQN